MNEFRQLLIREIYDGLGNDYSDNYYDTVRYSSGKKPFRDSQSKLHVVGTLINRLPSLRKLRIRGMASKISRYSDDFASLFGLLEDEASKDLLVKLAAYRILGCRRVKLPLNTPAYWKMVETAETLKDSDEVMDCHFLGLALRRFNLAPVGFPVRVFSLNVVNDFLVKQYELNRQGIGVFAAEGDVVIDGGGCWGDTALYFATKVGARGKVYSFEFLPSNISIFRRNLELNPEFADVIELIPFPLWSESGCNVAHDDAGPATRVASGHMKSGSMAKTVSIDDFVESRKAKALDFIKLDIEGAELAALRGAVKTLLRFRPKLAIALYHRTSDFYEIPMFLNSLGLGYKFYLSHASIHYEETMLIARAKEC